MQKFLPLILIPALVALFLAFGCEIKPVKSSVDLNANKKISIVTTTTQVTDIASRLLGNSCRITSLMGPGTDPHSYKPTAHDMTAISTADMILFHGLRLEGKLASILREGHDKITTYAVTSAIPDDLLLSMDEEESAYYDPHLWFSPKLWLMCVDGVSKFLIQELPELKDEIVQRKILLVKEIEEVTEWARSQLLSLPEEKRILITSHDAFRYLGKFFGIEVIALQGISTLQEAGLNDRTNLVDFIRKRKVKYLFIESSVNPKALREIAKETGAVIGAPLYSDAYGSADNQSTGPNQKAYPHNTWEGMLVYNILTIVDGLRP
ncbi:MAG: zinc ABC transporter substrate-binding protein [Verrucomicrobiota bacterium]|nr:zinc ABC transporter substrate-binding protein [Verrucomicrobiota bacterium]